MARPTQDQIAELLARAAGKAPPPNPPPPPPRVPPPGAVRTAVLRSTSCTAFALGSSLTFVLVFMFAGFTRYLERYGGLDRLAVALVLFFGLPALLTIPMVLTARRARRALEHGPAVVAVVIERWEVKPEDETVQYARYAFARGETMHLGTFVLGARDAAPVGSTVWVVTHPENPSFSLRWVG